MATQTTDQQNALKDAMARAKQIAAKLQQQVPNGDSADKTEGRKRGFDDIAEPSPFSTKKGLMEGTDPKTMAQKFAESLVQRSHAGPMLVEEVMIPNKIVGLVIGKGGEMINKLQSESGAKVQVAPDPPPGMPNHERQVTVTGNIEAVNKAKSLIGEIQVAGKIPERWSQLGNPGEFSVEMSISKTKVGLIIGKGGETIKSLQERAGCKMVLFQDGEYATAMEKPLRISGEQGAVMYGKQLVQDLLTTKELEGVNPNKNNNQGGNYKEMEVPREAVGLIIGTKGSNVNLIQEETGCRIRFKNDMEGPTKTAMLSGSPQQIAIAEAKLIEIIQTGNPGNNQGKGPGGPQQGWGGPHGGPQGNQGPGWRPPGGGNRQSNLQPGHKEVIIEVPANRCGLVIGKGGETIKMIRNESELNIQLDRNTPESSPFRVFTAQGTDEMIEKALNMIREKINDNSITARPAGGEQPSNPWGAPQSQWGAPQQQDQWNQPQQQQWPGQPENMQANGWGQPAQHPQGIWGQQAQPQQNGWNPAQPAQPTWDAQQQQWQQQNPATQNPWANQPQQQQQWGQPGQPYAAFQQPGAAAPGAPVQSRALTPGSEVQPGAVGQPTAGQPAAGQPAAAQTATGQPDYSAAWALYYQQQQYYQQYAAQQAAVSSAPGAQSAAVAAPSVAQAQAVSADSSQAQSMAEYQAKLAEYYKQYGQQVPQ